MPPGNAFSIVKVYPRSPHGERPDADLTRLLICLYFYPRSPHGERRSRPTVTKKHIVFLSTLSAWRATVDSDVREYNANISIHALRMESDTHGCIPIMVSSENFYPRSPHGERRSAAVYERSLLRHFYPRSPHGERLWYWEGAASLSHFYPRSPHGERHPTITTDQAILRISIHALRMESDYGFMPLQIQAKNFLSTLSAWRATPKAIRGASVYLYFYPRSPHGERPKRDCNLINTL